MTETPTYDVHISRWFAAPPELVYRAFVDPQQLAQWFGPLQFVVPLSSVDVDPTPGGHWRMTMVDKDDPEAVAPISATFTEIVENQLIVGYELTRGFPGLEDGTKVTMSVEFVPENGGTRLELHQGPLPEAMKEAARVGWQQSLYKLEALMATPAHFRNDPTTAKD